MLRVRWSDGHIVRERPGVAWGVLVLMLVVFAVV